MLGSYSLSEEQRHRALHLFHILDLSRDGTLDAEDFRIANERINSSLGRDPDDEHAQGLGNSLRAVFCELLELADRDRNNRVDPGEWLTWWALLLERLQVGESISQTLVGQVFACIDSDGDGWVQQRDWTRLFSALDVPWSEHGDLAQVLQSGPMGVQTLRDWFQTELLKDSKPSALGDANPTMLHAALPDLLPDLASGVWLAKNPRRLFDAGAELHSEVFAFRVAWERWTILRGTEAHRFFFKLGAEEVDPFHFRMRMPTLALPGVRAPADMLSSTRLTKLLLARQFQKEGLEAMTDSMLGVTKKVTDQRLPGPDGQVTDFFELWLECCTLSVSRALFGPSFAAACPPEFARWYQDIEASLSITRLLVPWWPAAAQDRAQTAMHSLIEWLRPLIAERRKQEAGPDDLLQGYLKSRTIDDAQIALDDDEILWTINSIQWAAHHYPAVHGFWTGAAILKDPALLESLLEEQGRFSDLNSDSVAQMHLLQGCILESLRVHPLVALPRLVKQDLHYRGVLIPEGTVIAVSPYLAHHDEAAFPEPERFDPGRWLPDAPQRPPLSFFPGGGGRWGCVGIRLTVSMLTGIWAHLLRNWTLELVGAPPQLELGPMLMPPTDKVQIRYRSRNN